MSADQQMEKAFIIDGIKAYYISICKKLNNLVNQYSKY